MAPEPFEVGHAIARPNGDRHWDVSPRDETSSRALEAWVQWLAEQTGGHAKVGSVVLSVEGRPAAERAAAALGWIAGAGWDDAQGFNALGKAVAAAPLPESDVAAWLAAWVASPADDAVTPEEAAAAPASESSTQDPASSNVGAPETEAPPREGALETTNAAVVWEVPSAPLPDAWDGGEWAVYLDAPGPNLERTRRLLAIGGGGALLTPPEEIQAGSLLLETASAPDARRLHTLVSTAASATLYLRVS